METSVLRTTIIILFLLFVLPTKYKCQKRGSIDFPEEYKPKVSSILGMLTRDFTSFWTYNDIFPSPSHVGATPNLIQKSIAHLGSEVRLGQLLLKALRGYTILLPIIGGSISQGAPFTEDGFGNRIFFHAIVDWWNKVFYPITGSTMEAKSVSLGGVGTDYYSYCLEAHLPEDSKPKLIIWELAANDRGRYNDKPFPSGQPLEQLTRNVLVRPCHPAFIFLNFFRGHDYSDGKCTNYEDEGGLEVAVHYNVTSLSWRNFVCDNVKKKVPLFSLNEIFGSDNFHPSILGHAQASFIVINYLRNVFLRVLQGLGSSARNIEELDQLLNINVYQLPPVMYHETTVNQPLCFTYLKGDIYESNSTLPAQVTRRDDYRFNIFKEFKIRSDKLGGMQTNLAEQLIQFQFLLPRYFSRLAVTSHAEKGAAQVWVDNDTPIVVETDDYHMGTKMEIIATNISPGRHTLNALSLKHGFVICAFGVV